MCNMVKDSSSNSPPPLPLTETISSDISGIGYDPDLEILDIKFRKSGKTYRYLNVGNLIHAGLMAAKSKGYYFAAYIKTHYQQVDL